MIEFEENGEATIVWAGNHNDYELTLKKNRIVNYEQKFINKRKDAIRTNLNEYDMTQQDLGLSLGHPKSYMSELINGISQFILKDLVKMVSTVIPSLESLYIARYLMYETNMLAEKQKYS